MSLILKIDETPFLFLGSMNEASDEFLLEKMKVTHILNCTYEIDNYFEKKNKFKYLQVELDDDEEEEIEKHFDKAHKFISKYFISLKLDQAKEENGRVLVHCLAGISRSSTMVISYIMREYKSSLVDSFHLVKLKRDIIFPNNGFIQKLISFEMKILGQNSISYKDFIVNRVFEYYYDFEREFIEEKFMELDQNYDKLINELGRIKYEKATKKNKD